MKGRFLIYCFIFIFAFSCSSDPCEEADNVECETGDVDGDGIINSHDTSPDDPCFPIDNLACTTGDIDGDSILNSEDSAPEDPCIPFDNVMCPTGDVDEDGIINSEDEAPLDFCIPIKPPLSNIIIGRWAWHISTFLGVIEFNPDGTYEDIENELLENGNSVEKTWTAHDDTIIEIINKNDEGGQGIMPLETISQKCHMIVFKGFSAGDFIFIKL